MTQPRSRLPDLMRKAALLVLSLLIIGIGPVTAGLGFCAKLPCCSDESHHDITARMSRPDCCDPVSCAEMQAQELTVSKSRTAQPAVITIASDVIVLVDAPRVSPRSIDDLLPPRTSQQRLSTLSLLLI